MVDVSFIIPYYNGQSTIIRCLDSIFSIGIDRKDFEVLLVDDCSQVPASAVLSEYISCHPNIRIIRHAENKCQGGAKNTGIKASNGRFIVFADQDDYILSENLNKAIQVALSNSPDMLSCRFKILYEDGHFVEKGLEEPKCFSTDGKTFCESFFDASFSLAPWSYIYSRDYLKRLSHPMEECVLMEDADWIAWHLIFAQRIDFLPLPIYCWVMNPTSITHGLSWRHKADWVKFGFRKIRDAKQYAGVSERFSRLIEEDGKYNIESAFRKLWKVDNCSLFYKHMGSDVLNELRQMQWSRRTRYMLNNPRMTILLMSLISPLLRGLHFMFSIIRRRI